MDVAKFVSGSSKIQTRLQQKNNITAVSTNTAVVDVAKDDCGSSKNQSIVPAKINTDAARIPNYSSFFGAASCRKWRPPFQQWWVPTIAPWEFEGVSSLAPTGVGRSFPASHIEVAGFSR